MSTYSENQLAKIIVNSAFHIHVKLGPGLFESVYERILFKELRKQNLSVERQVEVPVIWDDERISGAFRADLVVEGKVIVELKACEKLSHIHKQQLLTYLKLKDCKLGLLINFNESNIGHGIRRIVNGLNDAAG